MMIKVLQVLPSLNVCGGVENYLMNYYTHIDISKVSFDFVVHDLKDTFFKDIIEKRGGRIFILPKFSIKSYKKISLGIETILKNNSYDIIHCHQANAAFLYLKKAKKFGIECRILHSHQASAADKLSHSLRNLPLLYLGKKYTTHNFACSNLAGKYLYKKKKFRVINNAIDIQKFKYNENFRREIRDNFNIPQNSFVVGHIGRMCPQKNQAFAIEIFNQLQLLRKDAYMLIIGDGELREELIKKAKSLNLQDKIIFAGTSNETYKFYSAFDVFLLPSLYEGLPVVGIEAQTSGLPLITSDRVTKEVKILDCTEYLSLNDDVKIWADKILNIKNADRLSGAELVRKAGFDIKEESKRLERIYNSLIYPNMFEKDNVISK